MGRCQLTEHLTCQLMQTQSACGGGEAKHPGLRAPTSRVCRNEGTRTQGKERPGKWGPRKPARERPAGSGQGHPGLPGSPFYPSHMCKSACHGLHTYTLHTLVHTHT